MEDVQDTPQSWALPKQVKLTIKGKNYRWPMPVRRVRRMQEADSMEIAELFASLDTTRDLSSIDNAEEAKAVIKNTPHNAALSRRLVNKVLEFFEAHHTEIAGDMEKIEDALETGEIDEDELIGEWAKVYQMIMAPFVQRAKQRAAPSSTNGSGKTPTNSKPAPTS